MKKYNYGASGADLRPINKQTAKALGWNGAGQTDWELKKRVVISPPKKHVNLTKNPVICPRCNAELNKKNLAKHLLKHDNYPELWPSKKDVVEKEQLSKAYFQIKYCCLLCHNLHSKVDDFGRFIGNIDKHLVEEHKIKLSDSVIRTYYLVLKSKPKSKSKSKNNLIEENKDLKDRNALVSKAPSRKHKVFVVNKGKAIRSI